jgi:hypothetical protein
MINEFMIPIVSVISVAAVLSLVFYFRYKTRSTTQQTIRTALDKGQTLTPEIIESLGQPKRPPNADLRLGLIWIAVGLGCGAFGFILGEEDAVRPFLAIGAFPFIIGLAYLVIHWFNGTERSD